MLPTQEFNLYCEFKEKHKKPIEDLLCAKFLPMAESVCKRVTYDTGFPTMVGIPLFVVAVAWMCSNYCVNDWLIGLVLIGVGFIIRHHQKNVIYCTCRQMFWETHCSIIGDYIDAQMHEVMRNQSEDLHDATHRLYSYFYKQMISENFNYSQKGKLPRRK